MTSINENKITLQNENIHIQNENNEGIPFQKKITIKPEKIIIQELTDEHIERLCKKLCYGNRVQYQCTLDTSWSKTENGSALCEWGNASYEWMLSELLHLHRQNERNDRKITLIENYYRKIIHSVSFWERYKNWRFKRRLRVPDYIKVLDPDARKIFWWLHDQDTIANIAQRLGRNTADIRVLVSSIQNELSIRNRGYLLNPDVEVSLENLDPLESDEALKSFVPEDKIELHSKIKAAFQQLTWLEQFILDSMVVDNLQANSILAALKAQSISLSDKHSPDEMNTQHVYYFLRKTIKKLRKLSDIHNEY